MNRNQLGLNIFLVLGLLSACGDNGGSDATTTSTASDDASTLNDEVGTESATTETGDTDAGTTDASTTDASTTDGETTDAETTDASTTDGETTDAETTDGETTDGETTDATTTDGTTDATTDGTTDGGICGDFETVDDCEAAGCQAVNGQHLKQNGPNSPCLEASEFLGCIPESICGDAISWFCQGNQVYQVPDTCGPPGADPCDPPADPVSDCP